MAPGEDSDTDTDSGESVAVDADEDGFTADIDCDDADAARGPDRDGDGSCDAIPYTASCGAEMVAILPGSYSMGCRADRDGECQPAEDLHAVTISQGFWIGRHEVTQSEWEAAPQNAGWGYYVDNCVPAGDCPANSLSWEDATKFANWLSVQEGLDTCYTTDGTAEVDANPYDCAGYRLPTEAEWEYAARAGVDTAYAGGDSVLDVAWVKSNSSSSSHRVCTALLSENAWGLCDMSGNEDEWTNDGWLNGTPYPGDETDPVGTGGEYRIFRGGYWNDQASQARLAARNNAGPLDSGPYLGLRLARSVR